MSCMTCLIIFPECLPFSYHNVLYENLSILPYQSALYDLLGQPACQPFRLPKQSSLKPYSIKRSSLVLEPFLT